MKSTQRERREWDDTYRIGKELKVEDRPLETGVGFEDGLHSKWGHGNVDYL